MSEMVSSVVEAIKAHGKSLAARWAKVGYDANRRASLAFRALGRSELLLMFSWDDLHAVEEALGETGPAMAFIDGVESVG